MDAVAAPPIALRLTDLLKSLDRYDLLSNGVRDAVNSIVPGGAERIRELDDDALAELVFEVVKTFRHRRLEPVLSLHELPHPRYPLGGEGTSSMGPPPVAMWDPPRGPAPAVGAWKVLGFDVGFPVGIPSCELTCNADWIEYYARKGFNVLTYRTVRNKATAGSPYDWVFLAGIDQPWNGTKTPTDVTCADDPVPRNWRTVSSATSFVAPCPAPEIWEADIRDARQRLDALGDHLLIVSVTDSVPLEDKSPETLAADFVEVSLRAERAGAQVIECYLARATAKDSTGGVLPCERSTETSIAIVTAVRRKLRRETKLLIKLSGELSLEHLEQIVVPLAEDGLIDGVSGISPVRVERVVTGPDGRPLWFEKPPGVAGYALRDLSRAFVERLAYIRATRNLRFEIVAMGGIMNGDDVAEYLRLGASAVQSATAAVSDPGLAAEAFSRYGSSAQAVEDWNGVVLEVDEEDGTFWGRLVRSDGTAPDEEAQFELSELRDEQRKLVRRGALFSWRIGRIDEGGELVRRSSLRLTAPPPLTEDDFLAGKKLAEGVSQLFGSAAEPPLE